MKRFPPLGLAPLLLGAVLAPPSLAAGLLDGYAEPGSVAAELRTLAGRLPGGTIVEYGHSPDGRPLLALQVSRGSGDPNMRPALLIIGGVEPERLATVELALAIAGRAGAVPDSGSDPLATSVLYVIADPAPDGRARVLAGGGGWIGAPVDDDADGRLDEDGPEDLDGDGLVRWMRVWRNGGAYRPDTADVRASIKADAAAGQPGQFDLVREGKDNDSDDRIGEDDPGGVRLDANFPHGWVLFGPGAGLFPMSQPESKALADFVLARPNIAMALVLGREEILSGEGKTAPAPDPPASFPSAVRQSPLPSPSAM
ncbi:MAG: M14 family zinc carboxypeptidase, partial [Candidatus Eisenbacteria bacterium]|nr:M14 family zinc carboxypeptidase [Candidatus Eisenbacteria bacterium]